MRMDIQNECGLTGTELTERTMKFLASVDDTRCREIASARNLIDMLEIRIQTMEPVTDMATRMENDMLRYQRETLLAFVQSISK